MEVLKRCSKCGEEKPATTDYFHADKHGRYSRPDKLRSQCKACVSKYNREHYGEKPHTPKSEEYYAKRREYENSPKQRARRSAWQRQPAVKERRKQFRSQPGIKLRYSENRKARRSLTLVDNREKKRVAKHRRKARKHNLPNTWRVQHWHLCLEYWHNTCAVCGGQLRDLFGEIAPNADHWIALTDKRPDNPGTAPENMICLCSKCNFSKSKKPPEQWLIETYGTRKAKAIMQRIQDYFDWIKAQVV